MQLVKLFCINKKCKDYKKTNAKNISIIGHYGKGKYGLLRCKTCGFRFSERRLSIFFGLHTDDTTIREALLSLLYGKSIRRTAEEVGLDKDTVHRIWKRVIDSWDRLIKEFLEELNIRDIDLENLFSLSHSGPWRASINKRKG